MSLRLTCSQLTALLQIASPALPIGGFSYSQGLEAAIEHGLVSDSGNAHEWISQNLQLVFAACELPIWAMQYRHWQHLELDALRKWNEWFLASRESRELRMETEQMGWSFLQLMQETEWGDEPQRQALGALRPVALPTVHAWAAMVRQIPIEAGLAAYCFGWAESQVSAAARAVPLGQVAAQRILNALQPLVAVAVDQALVRARIDIASNATSPPPSLSTFAPQLAILSARHESQYSRLFRS
jgi:urease accessory protein